MSSSQVVKNNLLKSEVNQNKCEVFRFFNLHKISIETYDQTKETVSELYEIPSIMCIVIKKV